MSDPGTQKIPTVMPTGNRPHNHGKSLDDDTSRLDAVAKVTGRAKYSRDMFLPNGLFACFIRCPYGAGELKGLNEQAALAVEGVLEVKMRERPGSNADQPVRGRYHGHPVGWLVAESPHAMRRGMRALAAEWTRDAVKTEIDDEVKGKPETPAGAAALLDAADFVHEAQYSTPVQTHSALETHGGVIDHRGDSATCYISTQGTFAARDGLEESLGLPQSKYEVVCEYIGGGFGSKLNGAGKEGAAAAEISAKYKRPVYLFVDRAEDHLDTGNRPSSRTYVKLACKKDGTIAGGQIHTWGGVGVGRRGGGVSVPSGRYNLGDISKEHANITLNAGAPRPFRAPGHPQGAFAEELMLDEIATRAGIDPLQLRLQLETDDDRRKMFEFGARAIGWKQRQTTGSQKGVIRRGFGLGATSWPRFPSPAEAEVVIHDDGSVEARTGTQDIGTGQRTVMGVVAATTLGIPLARVSVRIGKSSLPYGPASGGSVTAQTTAPTMEAAAVDARNQLLERVAASAEVPAGSLTIADGQVLRDDKDIVLSWAEACAKFAADPITGRGKRDRTTIANDTSTGHSHGVQFVDLEVDTETGVIRVRRVVAVQACGKVVSRKTAESQIIGGVIQGISYALFEKKILDPNVGAMINANLEMYKVVGTTDTPLIEPLLWDNGATGVRSLGEPPTIPTAGAIAGAVLNAIGRPVRHLPLTPDKVLAALDGEGGAA